MKYLWGSIFSWAYWRYVLFSVQGLQAILVVFGGIYLIVETLDFFSIYERDRYAQYAFFLFLLLSIAISIFNRRPITSTIVKFPHRDFDVEVRIGDIFDASGAIMISSNTMFEADVAGGKISSNSLQGQFTARYFTGNQTELINAIGEELVKVDEESPYPFGTVVPITTHGKTFYFLAMAELNEDGNASTTPSNVKKALVGLWSHVRQAGELQELVVPLVGTGRGRIKIPRKKIIEMIVESFVDASSDGPFADRLVIVVHPADADKFSLNLWDIKDHLSRSVVI